MRTEMSRVLRSLAGALVLGAGAAAAQAPASAPAADTRLLVTSPGLVMPFGGSVDIVAGQGSVAGAVVTGRPYSAESVTESTQILADGNRITHTNRARVYRDSEGRTRREHTLAGLGAWSTGVEPRVMVIIDDPVAGTSHFLDPQAQTANEVPRFGPTPDGGPARVAVFEAEAGATNVIVSRDGARRVLVQQLGNAGQPAAAGETFHVQTAVPTLIGPHAAASVDERIDDLGEQVLEGVVARGTRHTQTIPAGAIGNERPIEIVAEQWYSEELGALIERRTYDPRFGETTYRLIGVDRSEPSPELFRAPADYRPAADGTRRGGAILAPAIRSERIERRMLVQPPQAE